MRLRAFAAIAVAGALAGFAMLEGALRVGGVGGPPIPRRIADGGFDTAAGYLVPWEGGWRTWYDRPHGDEVVIPPKGARTRVLLFGGSVAGSLGEGPLQKAFDAVAPGRYEAINLGRAGYGTERVRLIFRQALEHLEPDAVVLCMGDNEFVECSRRVDLPVEQRRALLPEVPWSARSWVLGAVRQLLFEGGLQRARQPEFWHNDHRTFLSMTLVDSRARVAAGVANVEWMHRQAVERELAVVICTMAYNRLVAPYASTQPGEVEPPIHELLRSVTQAARDGALAPFDALLPGPGERFRAADWSPASMGADGPEATLGRRPSTGVLAGAELVGGNPDDWTAEERALHATLARFHARELDAEQREALGQLRQHLAFALERAPDDAQALFQLGLVVYLLGHDDAAREFLERAAASDRAPRKGHRRLNEALRGVAAGHPATGVVDVDRLLRECTPGELLGFEWLRDGAHLHRGARRVVATAIAEQVLRQTY